MSNKQQTRKHGPVKIKNNIKNPDEVIKCLQKTNCLGPHMGSGQKYDFTREGNRYKSGPASYSIPTIFDMNKFKAKGINFRVSRNQAQQNSYMQNTMNPGPGKYKPETAPISDYTNLPSFSMPKGSNYNFKNDNPAPNQYIQTINYANSKHSFQGNTVIQPVASQRIFQKQFFNTSTGWKESAKKKLNQ